MSKFWTALSDAKIEPTYTIREWFEQDQERKEALDDVRSARMSGLSYESLNAILKQAYPDYKYHVNSLNRLLRELGI